MLEFSLEGYKQLLTAFKDRGYTFCAYEDIDHQQAAKHPFVVLRHDVDLSLRPALEMARVEHELGIQATYFVLLSSPFYNIFSRPSARLLSQLHRYGHHLAAHIDLATDDRDGRLEEVELLSNYYPYIRNDLASLHSPYDLQHIPIATFPQLDRVYGPVIRGDLAYISDSTGRWRYGHPLDSDAFNARKPIQLLIHPIWWVQSGETAREKLEQLLYSDYCQNRETLKEFLPKFFKTNES